MAGTVEPPIPDPTILTTEQLHREVSLLSERFDSNFASLEALIEEKFRAVNKQLDLVERQRVEQKSDTKAAVDAALTAQKEAVKEQTTASATAISKSEAGTKEQLNQLGVNFTTAITGLQVMVNDLKERVGKVENLRLGGREATNAIYALIGVLAILLSGALAVVGLSR